MNQPGSRTSAFRFTTLLAAVGCGLFATGCPAFETEQADRYMDPNEDGSWSGHLGEVENIVEGYELPDGYDPMSWTIVMALDDNCIGIYNNDFAGGTMTYGDDADTSNCWNLALDYYEDHAQDELEEVADEDE